MRFLIITVVATIICLPSCSSSYDLSKLSNNKRIENDLRIITKSENSRHYQNLETLNFVANYIYDELEKVCDTVFYQTFIVDGNEYKNVIGRVGPVEADKIVVGAHYDVCGNQEGADDNASGVVGLLEVARLIGSDKLDFQIEFVAYTLEEPPFFDTENMGSYVHAKSIFDKGEEIKGMVCLEMIGYFCDEEYCQDYPLDFLRFFYGNKGDYITVVQKFGNGRFGRQFKRKMKSQDLISTKSFKAPAGLSGIDLSDHRNYWHFGYSAVMITNTAFNRNNNYHKPTDKMETLDIDRMKLVIDEVYLSLLEFN